MAKKKILTEGNYDFSMITREDVLSAIKEVDEKGIPSGAHSSTHDVMYQSKLYPPKLLVSWAYRYATGKEAELSEFSEGKNTVCFHCLEGLGFEIVRKVPGVAYLKEVDYSLLKEGFSVTNFMLPKVVEVFGEVPESQAIKVNIDFEGVMYEAEFRHIKQKAGRSVFQVRYPANGELSNHLKRVFPTASKLLEELRKHNPDSTRSVKLPEDKKEHIVISLNPNKKHIAFRKDTGPEPYKPIDFQSVITDFIKQADEQKSLKTNAYPKIYHNLQIKVSFGTGNYARIPWISFLFYNQSTSKGIYPVFLYYKQEKLLLLSYGVSETHEPNKKWILPKDVQSVDAYFNSHGLGKPERYGNCFVFKAYSLTDGFDNVDFKKDLDEIISVYERIMWGSLSEGSTEVTQIPFNITRLSDISQTGLSFSNDLLKRYAVSLLTKPFVILSGLSGSGKTRLALAFAKWMAEDEKKQVKIVPVGADWNSREYLLGYPNGLTPGKYVRPENGVLDFVLEAAKEENSRKPFFLILDEMNLSYVERYFSDFLSAMESKEAVTLHPEGAEWEAGEPDVPARVKFPDNLFLIGTINVDETTYMFSPKVLDRANVIEFRISREEMNNFLTDCNPVDPEAVNGMGAPMGEDFVRICKEKKLQYDKKHQAELLSFFDALKPVGAEFGYRTADEIYRFMVIAKQVEAGWEDAAAMDIVVMQKMLPRLHGSRKKMQPVLKVLWELCKAKDKGKDLLIEAEKMTFGEEFRYPLSAEKVWLMYRNAQDNGFTSYAEA